MMRFLLIQLLLITCCPIVAQVINYEIDPAFNTADLYNRGSISSLLLHSDGRILVSGNFDYVFTPANGMSLIDADGGSFVNISSFNTGFPRTFHYLSNYLACGYNIARFGESGATDFSFRFEYQKPAYSGFLSSVALDSYIDEDDHVLVAGRFFTDSLVANNISSLRQLCRVDSTGMPDSEFPMLHCADPVNAVVNTIHELSSGAYILAGRFKQCNGHTYHNVLKLNPDFSVDTTFANPLVFRSEARVVYTDSLDRIYLKTYYGGLQSNPQDTVTFLRLLPNGDVDPSFQIPTFRYEFPDSPGSYIFGQIGDMVYDSDGTYILVGTFTEFNGHLRNGIVKITDDGTVVEGLFEELGADSATWGSWNAILKSVWKICKLPDGKYLLGGSFSSFGGEPYSCLVRLKPAGYVGVEEPQMNDLRAYPNPTTGIVKLSGQILQDIKTTALYDLTGNLLWSEQLPASDVIDLSSFPPGIYVLQIHTKDNERLTQKLVKY